LESKAGVQHMTLHLDLTLDAPLVLHMLLAFLAWQRRR
jgi:hypothetical protein